MDFCWKAMGLVSAAWSCLELLMRPAYRRRASPPFGRRRASPPFGRRLANPPFWGRHYLILPWPDQKNQKDQKTKDLDEIREGANLLDFLLNLFFLFFWFFWFVTVVCQTLVDTLSSEMLLFVFAKHCFA